MAVNPGSQREFLANNPGTGFNQYSDAVARYREQIATERGVSADELHFLSDVEIGSVALSTELEKSTTA